MSTQHEREHYQTAARPFIEGSGPIPAGMLPVKSWRYLIEVNTACNLKCAMCINGNREGYQNKPGFMDMNLLEKVLAKIHSENPDAIICPYGNGEPFLNPQFAECVAAIKRYKFKCEVATNLHYLENADKILVAGPDFLIVSTSGFTQPVYERAHRGGDIELVKKNLRELASIRAKVNPNAAIAISYHMYRYNLGEEMRQMEALAKELQFSFLISWARVISMENGVQALRHLDAQEGGDVPPYAPGKNGENWNAILPPAKPEFIANMEQLQFHPKKCRELYKRFPISPLCLIGGVFTYIRVDGSVQLCAWTDDTRFVLGNYLDMTQDQISEARWGQPFCRECLKYRLNLYFHVVDGVEWDKG